jgi:hypothetical protein
MDHMVFNSPATTGAGPGAGRRGIVLAGLAFLFGSITSASPTWAHPFDGTSASLPTFAPGADSEAPAEATAARRLGDAKRLSGLTWDELSRVMDTTRRTLHLWANGRAISSANEGRLGRLVGVLKVISRSTGRETRQVLLTPSEDGMVPFDLLVLGRFAEVVERLGRGRSVSPRLAAAPSTGARASRRPPSPIALLDAAQDSIGTTQLDPVLGKVVRRPAPRA